MLNGVDCGWGRGLAVAVGGSVVGNGSVFCGVVVETDFGLWSEVEEIDMESVVLHRGLSLCEVAG